MLQNLVSHVECITYSATSGDDLESFGNVTGIFLEDSSSSISANTTDSSGEPKSSTRKFSFHLRL